MKLRATNIWILSILFLLLSGLWAQEPQRVAFTTKVSGQVTLTNYQDQTLPLKQGTVLHARDKIETGSDGLAIIMFLDDKSILRIQKGTILTMGGQTVATAGGRAIDKQIDMQMGKLHADVAEQRQGEFVISTPISVASVKGTEFWTTSDPILGDIFLGVSGLIEIENLVSGNVISVGGGQMGSSGTDGTTEVTTYVLLTGQLLTVSESRLTMEPRAGGDTGPSFSGQIILTSQTTYAGPAAQVGATASVSGIMNDDGSVNAIQVAVEEVEAVDVTEPNRLRLQLEDENGNIKEVIILYQ